MYLAHCYRELFLIMDMKNLIGEVVVLIIEDTTMDVCIHEDNIVALILEETLPIQFTTQINNFVFKN